MLALRKLSVARVTAVLLIALSSSARAQSDIAANFVPASDETDFSRQDVMIAMRDGVRLNTIILTPKNAKDAPILLDRTPYGADASARRQRSTKLATTPGPWILTPPGYIVVIQDVRGRNGSEGEFIITRPMRGAYNTTSTDESTDAYDTIDWLTNNLKTTNGRVGITGLSYDGFLATAALIKPHPALKAAVPVNPMIDGWMGDDWFRNGAARQYYMSWVYDMLSGKSGPAGIGGTAPTWSTLGHDAYAAFLSAGSAGAMAKRAGMDRMGFWQRWKAHPSYDAYWQDQAIDRRLAKQPLTVPTMFVHGLFDQEDVYGAIAAYNASRSTPSGQANAYLALGPWSHGQIYGDGDTTGPMRWGSDTGRTFREEVLIPFLDQHLKTGAPTAETPRVTAFQTGANRWQRLDSWPNCDTRCPSAISFYAAPGGRLVTNRPVDQQGFDTYVSDPARPVPMLPLPIRDEQLHEWLLQDQRQSATRPDVLAYTSDALTAPLAVRGSPVALLAASTSGTDVDWVIKLIDVYPDDEVERPSLAGYASQMGGYQLMVSSSILRARYRHDPSNPTATKPNLIEQYHITLPAVNHVFRPGHKIMIQIQSSLFPLYDRNPQTFVRNIFDASSSDYNKSTQQVHFGREANTQIYLPTASP